MAKFCSKCGSELSGNVKFCSKCGASVQGSVGGTQGTGGAQSFGGSQGVGSTQGFGGQGVGGAQGFGNYGTAAVQKKSMKPVIAVGAVVVLAVIFILVKLLGGGSYKTPIEKLEKGMNKQDAKLISEAFVDGGGFEDSDVAALFSSIGGLVDYEIKLDILKAQKLEKSAIMQVLTDEYYVDAVYAGQAKAAYVLEVKMTMKAGEYTEEDTDKIPVAKIGGKWVIPMSISDI